MTTDEQLIRTYPGLPIAELPATLRERLPRDKFDLAAVDALAGVPAPELAPILPHLLTWLQDPNWPIARGLPPVLAGAGELLVEPVRAVLGGDDDIWIANVLRELVGRWPPERLARVRPELERLAARASEEEVDALARDLLGQ